MRMNIRKAFLSNGRRGDEYARAGQIGAKVRLT